LVKKLIFFLSITFLGFSQSINYAVLNNQAFVMNSVIALKASYLRVNDDLDFLNMRESELGTLSKYGSTIGDMSGYEAEIGFGLSDKDSIFLNFQEWNIDYGGSKLSNKKIELFNRFNLVSNQFSYINSLSFDIGYIMDFANRVEITNSGLMNSMIKKVSPNSDYSISDNGTILKNGSETTIYDKDSGNKISPSVAIDNLLSNSYYLKILAGKKISRRSILNLYSSYYYVDIQSDVKISKELLQNFSVANLNRSEHILNLGVSLISEFKYLIFEINYEYNKIYRDNLEYMNYSHNLDIAISKPITKNLLFFVSGKMMFQQLNRDIPYLYNQYTESQFDKKYGFAKFGLIYKIKGF